MALIPPAFLNTVVALGSPAQDGKILYNATGFMYGYSAGTTSENGQKQYHIFLVANRHVFERAAERSDTLHTRFNKPMGSGSNVYPMQLKHESWTVHPDRDADVAVMSLNPQALRDDGVEYFFFESDAHVVTLDQARTNQTSEGDGVFVLGSPL